MSYYFEIKGTFYGKNVFPDLNNYISECARSPHCGGKLKRDYMLIASNAIRRQLPKVEIEKPVFIKYKIYEATAKRDFSNVGSFATKVIEDSLQQCKVLKNDNQKCVRGYSHEFFIDRVNPRIEVEIIEIENEEMK